MNILNTTVTITKILNNKTTLLIYIYRFFPNYSENNENQKLHS